MRMSILIIGIFTILIYMVDHIKANLIELILDYPFVSFVFILLAIRYGSLIVCKLYDNEAKYCINQKN